MAVLILMILWNLGMGSAMYALGIVLLYLDGLFPLYHLPHLLTSAADFFQTERMCKETISQKTSGKGN